MDVFPSIFLMQPMLEDDDENYVWDDSFDGEDDVLDVGVEPSRDDHDFDPHVSGTHEHRFTPCFTELLKLYTSGTRISRFEIKSSLMPFL